MRKAFDMKSDLKIVDENEEETAEVANNKKLMNKGYAELLLSMDQSSTVGKSAFTIIRRNKGTVDGVNNAQKAFKALMRHFEPNTTIERGCLLKQFWNSKCHASKDPETFIYYMEELCD